MQFTLVGNEEGGRNITVFIPGENPLVAHDSHPNWDAIVEGVMNGDAGIAELFDVTVTAAKKFDRLSERVTVANGNLYLDGEPVHNALATQVVRFVREDVEDWKPLVAFFENVQANPNEHSREQLYEWIDRRDFTITESGMIVGYKGVRKEDDGQLVSIFTGPAIVNGQEVDGHVPNDVGSIIEMPRGDVHHDPGMGCSVGLHVGNWRYAHGFAQGAVLAVLVNPRDVVSVPTDSSAEKMRVCRYKVVQVLDAPYSTAVIPDNDWEPDDFEDEFDTDEEGEEYPFGDPFYQDDDEAQLDGFGT